MAFRSFKVVWLGSSRVLTDALDVYLDDDADYATRAAWLQTSLIPLIPGCKWHGSIRAFAGPNGPELTLKPMAWSHYYEAFKANGSGSFESEQSVIAGAWTYLKTNNKPIIVVTRFRDDESFIGQIKTLDYFAEGQNSWRKLPVNVRTQVHVLTALAAHPKAQWDAMPPEALKLAEVHYAFASKPAVSKYHFNDANVPAALLQSRDFVLKITELLFKLSDDEKKYWDYNNPPHIFGSALSDCLHDTLSPGTYTRDNVLKRARECGDVLLLHDSVWLNDVEIVKAALDSGIFGKLLPNLPEKMRDDKKFMLKAVGHNGCFLQYASDRLKIDADVCTTACIKHPFMINVFQSHVDVLESLLPTSPLLRTYARFYWDDPFCINVACDPDRASLLQLIAQGQSVVQNKHCKQWLLEESFVVDCIKTNWYTATEMNVYLSEKIGTSLCEGIFKRAFEARFKKAKWAMNSAIEATNALIRPYAFLPPVTFIPLT